MPLAEGSPLDKFRNENLGTSPADRAACLEGFTAIHDMYKKRAEDGAAGNKDGVHMHDGVAKTFNFVAYVRNEKGQVIELDGTKQGPWVVAEGVDEGGLMLAVAKEMQRRLVDGEIDPGAAAVMAVGP